VWLAGLGGWREPPGNGRQSPFANHEAWPDVRRRLASIAVILIGTVFFPAPGGALELGLTPSQVFSLWTNINDCLLASTGVVSGDREWRESLEATSPRRFEGKAPADVLERLTVFRAKLDELRRTAGLAPVAAVEHGYSAVTPSDVFLNSGQVLDGLVEWLIVNTGREQLVSRFYTRHGFTGKVPNDVFGLVDLADRRIDSILARRGG
jgi:hypothetical protein